MRYISNLVYRILTGYRMSIKIGHQTLQRKKVLIDEKDSITEVIIHPGVNQIEDYAFLDCTILNSTTIPNSVTTIGAGAFYGCRSLESITIPNSVTTIGFRAFERCTNLTSITIPDGVTFIGPCAFQNCTSLTSITIPNSVTSIHAHAFDGCTSITSITIPDGITSIGLNTFESCSSLSHLIIPNSLIDKDTKYWIDKGIDLNKTQLITHSQLSEWAKEYNLEGHYSIVELYTLYQLQKDDHYQPSWSELGKRSRHILVSDLLTVLPENKKNHVLPQTLIGQHGNQEKHSTKEEQLLHTLSLLSRPPAENLDQEKVSSYGNTSIDTKENSKDNSLSLGVSLASNLTLADTAKLLMHCTKNTEKLKAASATGKDTTSSSLRIRRLDSIKHQAKNNRQP